MRHLFYSLMSHCAGLCLRVHICMLPKKKVFDFNKGKRENLCVTQAFTRGEKERLRNMFERERTPENSTPLFYGGF